MSTQAAPLFTRQNLGLGVLPKPDQGGGGPGRLS